MKLLGFYIGLHDSNMAIYDGSVRYFKSERLYQIKHHHASLDWVREMCQRLDFLPELIAFSDGNRNGLGICNPSELFEEISQLEIQGRKIPTFCLDHHYAHSLSAWPLIQVSDIDYGVTIDGQGDHKKRISIIKQPGVEDPSYVFHSSNHAFGEFFNRIGMLMKLAGDRLDHAGKIMGANAYGSIDHDFIERFRRPDVSLNPNMLIEKISWRGASPIMQPSFFTFQCESFRDWLATVHCLIGILIEDILLQYIPANASIAYAGGSAQNTVFNQKLSFTFPGLNILPHCYDGGLSLGCIEFLRLKMKLPAFETTGFPFWQHDPDVGFASQLTIEKVAHHIKNGKVVGWMQGKGELGPRALGHRSILLDARMINGKQHLNTSVKKREHWRPYAASLSKKDLGVMFENEKASPFMLRAMKVRESMIQNLPAVVHVDGTCRAQSVNQNDPELSSFHYLIESLSQSTGVPAILNTSLNAAGGPIISTPEQGLKMFFDTPMDVICIGDSLFEK